MFLLCNMDCLENRAHLRSMCFSLLLNMRAHILEAKMKECSDTGDSQMRSEALDCTFPRDTECLLLPTTADKAGEDVTGAYVTGMWWCSLRPSPIPPLPCVLSMPSAALHQEHDLSLPAAGVCGWVCDVCMCRRGKLVAHNHCGSGSREETKCCC